MLRCWLVKTYYNWGSGEPDGFRKELLCPMVTEYIRAPASWEIGATGHKEDMAARKPTLNTCWWKWLPAASQIRGRVCFPRHQLPGDISSFWPTPYHSDTHAFPSHELDPASRFWTPSCLPPILPCPPLPPQSLTSALPHPGRGPPWPRTPTDSTKRHKWNFQELLMAASLMWLWRIPANVEAFISVHWFQFAVQSFPGLPLAHMLRALFKALPRVAVSSWGRPVHHGRAQSRAPRKQLQYVGQCKQSRANGKTFWSRRLLLN